MERKLIFLLAMSLVMMIGKIVYGESVVLRRGVFTAVAGNGTLPYGTLPFNCSGTEGNSITLNGASVTDVYGAITDSGTVRNNTAVINGSDVSGGVYGGWVNNGNANGNIVDVSGGTIAKSLFGGKGNNASATINIVKVSGGEIGGGIHGGCVNSGNVTRNVVRVRGGKVGESVCGAQIFHEGNAQENIVDVSGGEIGGSSHGGLTENGNVIGNIVDVSGGTISKDVNGGVVYNIGSANGNKVEVSGGTIAGDVSGVRVENKGDATINEVKVRMGEIGGSVSGGWVRNGKVDSNKVDVSGETIISKDVNGGVVYNIGNANGNKVDVSGGEIGGRVSGGWVKEGNADINIVIISSGNIRKDVSGGEVFNIGNANGNIVDVSGGEVGGNIHGGVVYNNGNANGNIVHVSGGEIGRSIYGGVVAGSGNANDNIVVIKENPSFSVDSTMIYGGYSVMNVMKRTGDIFSGNRLEIESREVKVKGVQNFEIYNFIGVVANAPVILTVEEEVDLTSSTVGVKVEGNAREGDRLNLIESQGEVRGVDVVCGRGGLIVYGCEREENPNKLTLMIRGLQASEQAQMINKAASAEVVVVWQGLGFIADRGIEEAVGAVRGSRGIEVFGVMEGDSNKYKKDTEVKIEGVKVVGGVAKRVKEGEVVIGGYVENGKGDCKIEEVEGKGIGRYTGIGLLVRNKIGERGDIDVSVRVGGYGIEYESEVKSISNEDIGYEYGGMYVGGHVGYGYKVDVRERINIGLKGKMLVTGQEGKRVKLNSGAEVEIEGVVSGKVKGEMKVECKCGERILPYIVMGYEYGLIGESKGKVEGVELREIDLKGGSGLGEIGIEGRIGEINIDIGARGHVGIREGIEGMLKVRYAV